MSNKQLLTVYVMLAKLSHNFTIDSEEFDAIHEEMTSLRERMT